MNKRVAIIPILVFFLSILCSCKDNIPEDGNTTTIVRFPSSVEKIEENRRDFIDSIPSSDYTLLFYLGSSQCTSCTIKHIHPLEGLYKKTHDYHNFSMVVLISPKQEEYEMLDSMLIQLGLRFPVYIDLDSTFEEINPNIFETPGLRQCILNVRKEPVLTGDPLSSDDVWNKYVEFMNNHGR